MCRRRGYQPTNKGRVSSPPPVGPAHKPIVTGPRILSTAEIMDLAIKICPRDQFGLVKMEDLEKACKIIRDINFWLVEL